MCLDHPQHAHKPMARKVWEIFITYFVSMLFAFTGGNMTWMLVLDKLVDKYQLIDREKTLEYFALGQALPGILSLNSGILIGRYIAGWAGAFAAAAGNILPAFFGMLFIALSYTVLHKLTIVLAAINGIRAASIAIIFVNALLMIRNAKNKFDWSIVVFALVCSLFFKMNILVVVLLCGAIGVVRAAWMQRKDTRKEAQ